MECPRQTVRAALCLHTSSLPHRLFILLPEDDSCTGSPPKQGKSLKKKKKKKSPTGLLLSVAFRLQQAATAAGVGVQFGMLTNGYSECSSRTFDNKVHPF